MTVGFPDYGRYTPVAGNLLSTFIATQAGKTGPLVNTGQYTSVLMSVNLSGASNFYQVYFQWFTDATGGVTAGESIYVPTPGQANTWSVPVLTAWCQITVVTLAGAAVESFPVFAYGSQLPVQAVGAEQSGGPIAYFFGNVGASSSQTVGPAPLAVGPATLSLRHDTNNTWNANIQYWDRGNQAYQTFISVFGSDVGLAWAGRISLPPAPVRVIVNNTDVAIRTMLVSLVPG